jgi:hypothetical protein
VLCSSLGTWAENRISFPCGDQLPLPKLSPNWLGVICRSPLPSSFTVKSPKAVWLAWKKGCGGLDTSPTWVGCFNPSWSPDGKKIVFGRQPATTLQRDIYTVNADGSGLFRVTNTPDVEEFNADWGTHPLTP